MSVPSPDLQRARLAIERLVCIYAEALDAGHVDKVASLFQRGQIRINGFPVTHKGSDAVLRMFLQFTVFYDKHMAAADPTKVKAKPWTKHLSTNWRYESLSLDHAVLWSDFTVLQGFPGESIFPIVSGRYQDTFSAENGEWYFVDRLEFIDLVGDVSRHLKGNPLGA